jgi:phage gp36-like protein
MAYTDENELRKRFGDVEIDQLSDPLRTGQPDTEVTERAIADADALINAHLSARYSLPLASVPAVLVTIACDVARFKLWHRNAPQEVRDRYDDALDQLKMFAQGLLTLPPDAITGDAQPVQSIKTAAFAPERIFTADKLSGY